MTSSSSLEIPSFAEESHDPVLSDGEVLPVRWCGDILASMDWRKLVEIIRAVSVFAGCKPGATAISADGSAEFEMARGHHQNSWTERVRLAPWNRWMAMGECIEQFAASLSGQKNMKGVYVAPGGVSLSGRMEAGCRGIMVVDADSLAATLNDLPRGHSEFFHDIITSGTPFVPTCPVCLRHLSQAGDSSQEGADVRKLPDVSYGTSDIVAEPVLARRLEILRNCEVHFLREARARDIIVNGIAIGDFVCEGCLIMNPGSVLIGTVAARSVLVRPGAELRGETRILKGTLNSMEKESSGWLWRCAGLPAKPGCTEVAFLPH